jgi:hypothetical protein
MTFVQLTSRYFTTCTTIEVTSYSLKRSSFLPGRCNVAVIPRETGVISDPVALAPAQSERHRNDAKAAIGSPPPLLSLVAASMLLL